MKIVLILCATITAAFLMYVRTPVADQHVHEPVADVQSGGAFQRIGLSNRLTIGTSIYFRTNFTSCGRVRAQSKNHRYPDGATTPSLLIQWNDGNQEWVKRKSIAQAWIQSKQALSADE